jgi:hypothetical protein|tara:strand:- start:14493 stop:14648 length:156 start_codon:yes stop_codon:yes gene_type:complete
MRQYGTSCAGSDPAMTVAIVTTVIAEFAKAQERKPSCSAWLSSDSTGVIGN